MNQFLQVPDNCIHVKTAFKSSLKTHEQMNIKLCEKLNFVPQHTYE